MTGDRAEVGRFHFSTATLSVNHTILLTVN